MSRFPAVQRLTMLSPTHSPIFSSQQEVSGYQATMDTLVLAFRGLAISDIHIPEDAAVYELAIALSAMTVSESSSHEGPTDEDYADDATVVDEDVDIDGSPFSHAKCRQSPPSLHIVIPAHDHPPTSPPPLLSHNAQLFESPLILVEAPLDERNIEHLFSPGPSSSHPSLRRPSFTYTLPHIHVSPSVSGELPSPTHLQTTFSSILPLMPATPKPSSSSNDQGHLNISQCYIPVTVHSYPLVAEPFHLPTFALPHIPQTSFLLFSGHAIVV